MSREPTPDLTRLAILAQTRTGDLKPLLLKVHAMTFAAADTPDAATTDTFETLARGLIPLVAPEVAAEVRDILAGVRGVSPEILALLLRQSSREEEQRQPAENGPISPERLRALVESGRRRPALARELLARPELSPFDRAALYRHGDDAERDAIRAALELPLAARAAPAVRAIAPSERATLAIIAQAAGFAAASTQIAHHLAVVSPPDWRPHRPLDAEMFALALTALGVEREESVRLFLTVDEAISHSVRTVFRLGQVVRTPPAVAAYLVAVDLDLPEASLPFADTATTSHAHDTITGRASALPGSAITSAREPDREGYGRPGYRSRSTISRDRR